MPHRDEGVSESFLSVCTNMFNPAARIIPESAEQSPCVCKNDKLLSLQRNMHPAQPLNHGGVAKLPSCSPTWPPLPLTSNVCCHKLSSCMLFLKSFCQGASIWGLPISLLWMDFNSALMKEAVAARLKAVCIKLKPPRESFEF